jgi:hypothetical protein
MVLTLGVIIMVYLSGCAGGIKYDRYSNTDPSLNLSMDYILGWEHDVQYGSRGSFVQVLFIEHMPEGKTYAGMMVVTVKDRSKLKLETPTIEGIKDDIIEKRFHFKEPKLLSAAKTKFLGREAIEFTLSYTALDSFNKLSAKFVPIKERIIIFERNDKFYIIRYENLADDFDKYSKAFDHIVRSIKFI